jgi:acyl-CoA thioester hydrolase
MAGLKEHEIRIRVRYAETDSMGVVHHANYLTYFEMGRTELYRAAGGNYRRMEQEGLFLVVAEMKVKYRKAARYDDVLTVRTRIKNISAAKLEHQYEIFHDGDLLTSAETVLACVDGQGKLRRIPDAIVNG